MKRAWVFAAAAALMSCPPPEPTDVCKGRVLGDLVISEVMLDPEGTDTGGEWIELFNTLGTPLDLKGLTLYVRDTDGSGAKTHAIRAGTAPGRGYFVVGDIRSGPNPTTITVTAKADDGASKTFTATCRIDTPNELDYYRHGGILQYVLRSLAKA